MSDPRLRKFEKGLEEKIGQLKNFAKETDKKLNKYGSYMGYRDSRGYSITALTCERKVKCYQKN